MPKRGEEDEQIREQWLDMGRAGWNVISELCQDNDRFIYNEIQQACEIVGAALQRTEGYVVLQMLSGMLLGDWLVSMRGI